jgi:diaminopimelate epimerase
MARRVGFVKMHGAGNDFVLFAGADLPPEGVPAAAIRALCRRRTGIGADGLIVVAADPAGDVDFTMAYYNRDGGEADMCGNGARCAVAFAKQLGLAGPVCRFRTRAGDLTGRLLDGEIEVSLPRWNEVSLDLPLAGSPFGEHHFCHTGVPHLVVPVEDVDAVDPVAVGPLLRHHAAFAPHGTNVDWVGRERDSERWRLRTFERGVESETLACGTGAAAAAVVLVLREAAASPVVLVTRSGAALTITVDTAARRLALRGPVATAFTGTVEFAATG